MPKRGKAGVFFAVADRQTPGVRHPWHALTRLLIEDSHDAQRVSGRSSQPGSAPASLGEAAVREAWTETASRLSLIRMGWWSRADCPEPDLAFPGDRALLRTADRSWRLQAARCGPGEAPLRSSHCRGEDEIALPVEGALLVAAAQPGRLPATEALTEVASLALALWNRRALLRERAGVQLRLSQAQATAAAGHDLRNELTRALLYAGRGHEDDRKEVISALGAARDLAHAALLSPEEQARRQREGTRTWRWEAFDLRTAVTEEVRAAAAAVRAPEGHSPTVRLKCPKGVLAFTDERMFRRALRNVVLNSMEASVRQARVRGSMTAVTVLAERLPEASASGYGVQLTVSDAGTGMPAEEVQRFLEPRAHAHPTPSADAFESPGPKSPGRESPGLESPSLESTGLGTASLAVALTQGALPLRVKSRPGTGTDVTLWIRTVGEPKSSPRFVVDPDPRRARRLVIRERAAGGDDSVWAVLDPRASLD